METPSVRYTRVGKASVAFQTLGEGPDLIFHLGWPSHLDLLWEHPAVSRFFHSLSSFCRLILFDHRGTGLSDRGPMRRTTDDWLDDIGGVLDAVGSRRAALFAGHLSGRVALLFAATRPDRISAIATFGSHPTTFKDEPDYPWGTTRDVYSQLLSQLRSPYESDGPMAHLFGHIAPSVGKDPDGVRWWTRLSRAANSPAELVCSLKSIPDLDIRSLLPTVRVPVLLLHSKGDRMSDVNASRYMAERLPNGRLLELPGADHLPFFEAQDTVLAELRGFLGVDLPVPDATRQLATVMFTDIVDSTDRAQRLGDRGWQDVLESHNEIVARQVRRFAARFVKSTGDGVLATFDSPIRALRCSGAIQHELRPLDIDIRTGIHAGEIEIIGDDIMGIAVHIAQRVQSTAEPGEVLVSSTVKDLSTGSPVRFTDRGVRRLKGIPEPWRLFMAAV
ncbi:MAG: adenylate/guanylate cyclase domain-containing protein [Acidimicrobiales bacterium]|jgi:class 3 adenylate cyclase/pimeloyl-ACP methyl ester carboxylesterase